MTTRCRPWPDRLESAGVRGSATGRSCQESGGSLRGADGRPLNPKPIYSQGQNIWRYHPELRRYEIFAEGGGNAFGVEIADRHRAAADLRELTVTLNWNTRGIPHTRSITTYIAKDGIQNYVF